MSSGGLISQVLMLRKSYVDGMITVTCVVIFAFVYRHIKHSFPNSYGRIIATNLFVFC